MNPELTEVQRGYRESSVTAALLAFETFEHSLNLKERLANAEPKAGLTEAFLAYTGGIISRIAPRDGVIVALGSPQLPVSGGIGVRAMIDTILHRGRPPLRASVFDLSRNSLIDVSQPSLFLDKLHSAMHPLSPDFVGISLLLLYLPELAKELKRGNSPSIQYEEGNTSVFFKDPLFTFSMKKIDGETHRLTLKQIEQMLPSLESLRSDEGIRAFNAMDKDLANDLNAALEKTRVYREDAQLSDEERRVLERYAGDVYKNLAIVKKKIDVPKVINTRITLNDKIIWFFASEGKLATCIEEDGDETANPRDVPNHVFAASIREAVRGYLSMRGARYLTQENKE